MKKRLEPALWEQQFDRSWDYPETAVVRKYAICTSPRSGSHYLGHLLLDAGGFGYPLEYVHPDNYKVWTRRAHAAGDASTLEFVKRVRTDRNGVFGIKLHFSHLPHFLENEPDPFSYRFITLERRDLVKQAVSYSWAAQTQSWISGMPPRATAVYDWRSISVALETISKSNAGWRSFFAGLGIDVCHLVFEDVRADPEGAVRRIRSFLGIEALNAAKQDRSFFPSEQSEAGKKDWVARFIRESREKLGRGELVRRPINKPKRQGMRWRSLLNRGKPKLT